MPNDDPHEDPLPFVDRYGAPRWLVCCPRCGARFEPDGDWPCPACLRAADEAGDARDAEEVAPMAR